MMCDEKIKIAISGAGGFLGRCLSARLLANTPHEVVAITSKHNIEAEDSRLMVISSRDWKAIESELADSNVFVNCAFPRNTDGESLARGMRFVDRLFELAGKNPKCAVINVSSQSVYNQRDPKAATEQDDVSLGSIYAVAKFATELLLDSRCGHNKRTNIRLASLIGSGFDQRVVNKMTRKVLSGEALTVVDNGSRFGYLDVRDAADALVSLCRTVREEEWEIIYNVGSSSSYSLIDIAESVATVCGRFRCKVQKPVFEMLTTDDPGTYSILDSRRFIQLTGWKPCYSLDETISSICEAIDCE